VAVNVDNKGIVDAIIRDSRDIREQREGMAGFV